MKNDKKMMKNDEKWFHSENDENHRICRKKQLKQLKQLHTVTSSVQVSSLAES
jgi:hypothetical protein